VCRLLLCRLSQCAPPTNSVISREPCSGAGSRYFTTSAGTYTISLGVTQGATSRHL
jgi:hypothetical protein